MKNNICLRNRRYTEIELCGNVKKALAGLLQILERKDMIKIMESKGELTYVLDRGSILLCMRVGNFVIRTVLSSKDIDKLIKIHFKRSANKINDN